MKELIEIQKLLKAPKNQRNNFGNYNYRSCEDILEAVKPLCVERGCMLTLSDEVVNVGQHNYIKATAKIIGLENIVEATGWARESVTRKGMDDSQITGSASSYARKYALNGLFCIDDTKDADSSDNRPQPQNKAVNKVKESFPDSAELATTAQVQKIQILVGEVAPDLDREARLKRMNGWLVNVFPDAHTVTSTKELTKEQAGKFIEALEKQKEGMENG
jgi:hypothetical protein